MSFWHFILHEMRASDSDEMHACIQPFSHCVGCSEDDDSKFYIICSLNVNIRCQRSWCKSSAVSEELHRKDDDESWIWIESRVQKKATKKCTLIEYRIRIASNCIILHTEIPVHIQCVERWSSLSHVVIEEISLMSLKIGMTERSKRRSKKCSNDAFFRQDRDLESNELSQSRQRWCVASLCMEIYHITQNDDSSAHELGEKLSYWVKLKKNTKNCCCTNSIEPKQIDNSGRLL